VPKERPRFSVLRGKIHTYSSPTTAAYEKIVFNTAMQAIADRYHRLRQLQRELPVSASQWPKNMAYRVTLFFYRKDFHRYDVDNAVKSSLDGAGTLLWEDDSQVVETHAFKSVDADNPRTDWTVDALEEYEFFIKRIKSGQRKPLAT
jgi:Holliday junction resolvase RusA-like endonuclease